MGITRRKHSNNIVTTLNGSITNSATSLTVTSAAGFPTIGTDEVFRLTLVGSNGTEVVEVTDDASSPTFTVTRGVDGTSGLAFDDGDLVEIRTTADSLDRKKDLESITTGITASVTQTQGQGPLTAEINVVSTCATANDTVTLPPAYSSYPTTIIIKNDGAETLQVFPASGDNLGAGVDTSTTITSGSYKAFINYDDTVWIDISGGGGAVDSVNSQTGTVVLDADDIDDTSTTNKFTTAGDISKLAGIETAADVTDETNVKAALDGSTTTGVTPASGDKILLLDVSDSDNLKHALFSTFGGGSSSFAGFRAYRATAQSLDTVTFTKIQIDTADFNTESTDLDLTTNFRHTPTKAGKWLYIGLLSLQLVGDGVLCRPNIYKNGSADSYWFVYSGNGPVGVALAVSAVLDMNGSTDYVELYGYHNHGSNRDTHTTPPATLTGIYLGT